MTLGFNSETDGWVEPPKWGVTDEQINKFMATLSPVEMAYAASHPFQGPHPEEFAYWSAGIKNQQNQQTFLRSVLGEQLTPNEQLAVDMPGYSGQSVVRGFTSPYIGIAVPESTDNPAFQQSLVDKYQGILFSKEASDWAANNTAAAQAARDSDGGLGTLATLALLVAAVYTGGAAAGFWGGAEAAGGAAALGAGEAAALGSGITYSGATAAAIGEGALGAGITYSGASAASIGGGALGAGITGSGISSAALAGYGLTATATAAEVANAASASSWFENAKSAYNVASKANTVKNALTSGSSAQKFSGALGAVAPAAAASTLLSAPAAAGVATAAGAAAAAAALTGAQGATQASDARSPAVPLNPQVILVLMLMAGTFFIFKGVKHG